MSGAEQPPEQKGGQGKSDHAVAEASGHAIRQPLNRGPTRLGLLHQADDPGQGRFRSNPRDLQHERCIEVEAAGGQLKAGFCLPGQRFTGEAGGIHRRIPLHHNTIHGHTVPRQQLQPLPGAQGPDPHIPDGAIRQHQTGRIGLQLGQLMQRLTGAEAGPFLQEAPQQHETQQHHRLVEKTGPADLGPDQCHKTGQIGAADPQTHQGVHAWRSRPGSRESTQQNRPTGTQQGHGGQRGMERQAADQGQRQMAGLAEVTKHRQQQQREGHHQLAPLLPPGQSGGSGRKPSGRWLQGAFTGRKSTTGQGAEYGVDIAIGFAEIQPCRTAHQVHISALHPRLLEQGALHGSHTASAFHPLHIEDDGLNRRTHWRLFVTATLGRVLVPSGWGPSAGALCPAVTATTTSSTRASR